MIMCDKGEIELNGESFNQILAEWIMISGAVFKTLKLKGKRLENAIAFAIVQGEKHGDLVGTLNMLIERQG